MANVIKIKRGSITPSTSNLESYELGYKTGTTELYINDNGTIRQLGGGAGDIEGVTAGSGLSGGGTTGTVTLSHADTSSAANLTASSRTYVTALTFDTYGHVTGYSTGTETVTDTNTTYSAGTGLALSGTTFNADFSEFTDLTTAMANTDEFIILDAGVEKRKAANEIGLSIFSNDSGFTSNSGTVTSVATGGGLTGGTITSSGTISHADTSTAANLTASGRTYVTGLTFDTYGHVTGYTTGTETVTDTNTTYTGTDGVTLVGTSFRADSTVLRTDTTFGGDVSGAYNSIVVADDSHNHIISNVDGLQTALDAKLTSSSALNASNLTSGTVPAARIAHNTFDIGDTTAETGRTVHETGIYTFNRNNGNLGTGTDSAYYSVLGFGQGAGGMVQIAGKWTSPGNRLYWRSLRDTIDDWWEWRTIWHSGHQGSGSGLDADLLDGQHASAFLTTSGTAANSTLLNNLGAGSFLRSDADDTWSGNISTTSTNGIRFGSANQTNGDDGFIAAGRYGSGLNIVGTQTTAGTGRQVRIWGNVIDSSGNAFLLSSSGLNGSNITSGTVAAARIASLDASKITSGTFADARIASASNWNTAYGWGNHASQGYVQSLTDLLITATATELNYVDGVTSNIQTQLNGKLSTSGKAADADLLDGQNSTYYAQASKSNNKDYYSTANAAGSYLGGHYSSGGTEKPNSNTFGAGKLKHAMLSNSNLGFGGSWNDVIWVSSYTGGDVKSSHALVFDKYSTNVYVSDQNYDATSWGTGYKLWHNGNDGSGTGLDADLLDGNHASAFLGVSAKAADSNLLDGIDSTGFTRKGVESGTPNTASNKTTFTCEDALDSLNGNQSGLQVWQDTANADAFMTFHVAGDYAVYFGLDGGINDLAVGGWSMGANSYRIWHQGNDGGGSGLDADTVDGIQGGSFLRSDAADTFTGKLTGSNTAVCLGYDSGSTNSFQCSNWFRSSGSSGWYNGSYGGGINQQDTTWVRVYNSKAFYVANQIAASGDVTAYYSDERLKTKIETIDNAVDKVMSLEGFIYEENELAEKLGYTNKGKRQAGVSAQQVQKVLPEAVTLAAVDMETDEFSGEITSKSGENYLTVKYEKLVPLLIQAIKEQQQQINELKEQLNG